MRVLVTGSNGFLGFEAVRRLAACGLTVIALDATIGPHLSALASTTKSVVPAAVDITDLANLAQIFKAHRPGAVIHCAAIVGVLASLSSPANTLRVNVHGSLNVFEAMRLFDVQRVIHLSSEEIYGDFQRSPADEEHPQNPRMPYGITKLAVEHFGRAYHAMHGLECINIRTSWVYGVRLHRPRPPMSYLNAALCGKELHIVAGRDTYIDYTYVDDLLEGILLALNHGKHHYDAYNIASGKAVNDAGLVELIKELIPGARLTVGPGLREFAPGIRIPRKGALDCTRAKREFGYEPKYDIRRGLEAYVTEWRKNGSQPSIA